MHGRVHGRCGQRHSENRRTSTDIQQYSAEVRRQEVSRVPGRGVQPVVGRFVGSSSGTGTLGHQLWVVPHLLSAGSSLFVRTSDNV